MICTVDYLNNYDLFPCTKATMITFDNCDIFPCTIVDLQFEFLHIGVRDWVQSTVMIFMESESDLLIVLP